MNSNTPTSYDDHEESLDGTVFTVLAVVCIFVSLYALWSLLKYTFLSIAAVLTFLGVLFFMYVLFAVALPLWLVMMISTPLAPFIFGWRSAKHVFNGNFKKAFA